MNKIPLVDLKAQYLSMRKEIDGAIQKIVDDSSFIMGEPVRCFEQNFARFCRVKYVIGCSSGSSALDLALMASGIGKGDEVITVPNTFIATTEAITHVGAKIKFVDINKDTLLMDLDKLEKTITQKTKAIIPVHLHGQMCDMRRIREVANDNNLIVIEDSAQAHGATFNGRQPGYYGDAATFSFFPAKNLGCFGDGGAVITNNSEIAEKVRLLANHGKTSKHKHAIEGYNYRLDAIQASILDVKLPYLSGWIEKRRRHAKFYDVKLPSWIMTPVEDGRAKHVYHMYVIRVNNRDKLMKYLKAQGIGCGIHYPIPLHLQPAYEYLGYKKGSFPVAEEMADKILSIPVYPELTYEQQEYIIDKIKEFGKSWLLGGIKI